MAIFVAVLVLVLLFTAGLTLGRRFKRWRPVGALLMLLPMTVCGMMIFSVGVYYSITESVAVVHPDSNTLPDAGRESVVETETRTEVDVQGVIMAAGLGVLFIVGLLVWGTMFLAWLRRRVGPRTTEAQE